jgi:CheY-like chemotaxis protein
MIKKVLIVDDDQEMLLSLKEGFEKYIATFSVLMAGDGLAATEKLEKETISLVITDLRMPRMDGFALLSKIMEQYPDIPVIIMTGYSTPEMEKLAQEVGAVGYVEKPFMIDDLAKKVLATLRKESEGGTLHSISSGMFLQLIEMEQKTCTIRLFDKTSGKQGVLFFCDGELFDARTDGLKGEAAAYKIFSWDEVNLSIQNECRQKEQKVHRDINAILLEAMRLKDEAGEAEETEEPEVVEEEIEEIEELSEELEPETPDPLISIQTRLKKEIGERCGLEDIYQDNSWDGFMAQISRMGAFFDAGKLKLAYLDRSEPNDLILLPGYKTSVLLVNSKCPRDRIITILSE